MNLKTKTVFFLSLLLAGGTLYTATPSHAADPVAAEKSPWMIRLRGLVIGPKPKSHLHLGSSNLKRNDVRINTTVIPELDISYFFTDNIAAELILGTSRQHIKGKKDISGTKIGRVWLLPPTLTLQYHFDFDEHFKPYLGAGVNYTIFYGSKKGDLGHVSYKNRFSPALQAGIDYMVDDHWGLNIDVKKLFLKTHVKIDESHVGGRVKINPWLVGAGVSYRF